MPRLTPIPDVDSLLRHVGAKHLHKDADGRPVAFLPQAFELRPEEAGLSAAWPQHFGGLGDASTREAALFDMASAFEIKSSERFAHGRVGNIRETCDEHRVQVRIVHDGEGFACHATVLRYATATIEVWEKLARDAWSEMIQPSAELVAASKEARRKRSRA